MTALVSVSIGYQPQQSVLKPHAGHRQTACMRNISAPQRSQSVFSIGGAGRVELIGRGPVACASGAGEALGTLLASGMRRLYEGRPVQ